MGKVILEMSISLDGIAAGPNVTVNDPMGRAGLRLHEWIFGGKTDIDAQILNEMVETSGSVIVGGQTYHIAIEKAWGGVSPFSMPAFVVTSTVPETPVYGFTYITTGIEDALLEARKMAGEKSVWVMGGARLTQSLLKAGLLDELHIHIIPILLGEGLRLFDQIGTEHIELNHLKTIDTPGATHLFFQVLN